MLINLFYILLFAIATVIICIWGMKKEQSKEKELLDNLYKKSENVRNLNFYFHISHARCDNIQFAFFETYRNIYKSISPML